MCVRRCLHFSEENVDYDIKTKKKIIRKPRKKERELQKKSIYYIDNVLKEVMQTLNCHCIVISGKYEENNMRNHCLVLHSGL